MSPGKWSFLALCMLLLVCASACMPTSPPPAPTQAPTNVPTETRIPTETPKPIPPSPTATETLEPTITPTATDLPPLGESGNPIVIALVPGLKPLTETDLMGMGSLINQEVDTSVKLIMAENYADAVMQMCAGMAHATILNTSIYLEAHKMGCADAYFLSRSAGSSNDDGRIIFRQDSGGKDLESLYGKAFCRPFWTPTDYLDGSPETLIKAVHDGACDAALVAADVREGMSGELPDILDTVQILEETIAYPHDNISFAPGLPEEIETGLTKAFVYLSLFNGGQAIKEIYGWDNLIRIDDSYYEDLREFYAKMAIGLHESGLNVEIQLFQEGFDQPEVLLQTEEYETGALRVIDGEYVVIAYQGTVWGTLVRDFADMVIEVMAEFAAAPEDGSIQADMRCREQENSDGYRFLLNSAGQISVVKVSNRSDAEVLLGWTDLGTIFRQGSANRLKVICTKNNLLFYVNGQMVFQGQDDSFPLGVPGIGASTTGQTTAEAHFDNLFIAGRK